MVEKECAVCNKMFPISEVNVIWSPPSYDDQMGSPTHVCRNCRAKHKVIDAETKTIEGTPLNPFLQGIDEANKVL